MRINISAMKDKKKYLQENDVAVFFASFIATFALQKMHQKEGGLLNPWKQWQHIRAFFIIYAFHEKQNCFI